MVAVLVRRFILTTGLLSLFAWGVWHLWPRPTARLASEVAQASAASSLQPKLAPGPITPSETICERWSYRLEAGADLAPELEEMSGLGISSTWSDLVYHVADSGNEPHLLLTTGQGKWRQSIPFADRASDPEDLSLGPCPWGGSCIFVADTGDNLKLRSDRQIHIIEEASLFHPTPRRSTLSFYFPNAESLDIEGIAVHPRSGDIYVFSKERKQSRVFLLSAPGGDERSRATPIAQLPFGQVTGAAMHPAGDRFLIVNKRGAFEISSRPLAGFEKKDRAWFAYQRKISIPPLTQTEAITYAPSGLSFFYTSERKKWSKEAWGLMQARCIHPLDSTFPHESHAPQ